MSIGTIITAIVLFSTGFIVGFILGYLKGDNDGITRIKRDWTESLNSSSSFYINCPICDHRNPFEKGKVRSHLEATKPWVSCSVCDVSLIQPYMQHEFVKKARERYVQLAENNKTMRAILNEPYHPVNQAEEEAIREEVKPLPESRASNQMISLGDMQFAPPIIKRKQ